MAFLTPTQLNYKAASQKDFFLGLLLTKLSNTTEVGTTVEWLPTNKVQFSWVFSVTLNPISKEDIKGELLDSGWEVVELANSEEFGQAKGTCKITLRSIAPLDINRLTDTQSSLAVPPASS
jgi:hypothetical protein